MTYRKYESDINTVALTVVGTTTIIWQFNKTDFIQANELKLIFIRSKFYGAIIDDNFQWKLHGDTAWNKLHLYVLGRLSDMSAISTI